MKYLYMWTLALLLLTACQKKAEKTPDNVFYTCSMDPQVMEKKPGKCPICKMELTRIEIDPHQNEGIMLSDEQIELANISTEKVVLGTIGIVKTLQAKIVENQNLKSRISSRISGRIDRLYFKNPGDEIKKGDILYQIYSEELLVAQNDYLNAIHQLENAQKSAIDFNALVNAAKSKLLLWGLSEKQIETLNKENTPNPLIPIYSKSDGIITSVEVSEGDYVTEGAMIFETTNYNSLWVEAEVYPTEIHNVAIGQKVKIRLASFANQLINSTIIFISPQLLTQSKINLVRMEIPNADLKIKPGMQAFVDVCQQEHKAILISSKAVLQDSKGSTVWIKKDGAFENRMVKTGISNHQNIEILEGLKEGQEVVVSGAYLLNSESIFKKGANPMEGHKMEGM